MAPPRPLVATALALAAGALIGHQAGCGAAAAAGAALTLMGLARPSRRLLRSIGLPSAAGCLLALAGARAHLAETALPQARLMAPARLEAPLAGRYHSLGRLGWLEPARGRAPGLLLELDAPPEDGTEIVVFEGPAVLAWAGGPEPGPRAREGRFQGLVRLAPDQWMRRSPAATGLDLPRGLSSLSRSTIEAGRAGLARRLGRFEARTGLGRGRERGLFEALLLGTRTRLSRDLVDLFKRTGTRHMLTISGLHVGLLVGLLLALAVRLAPLRRPSGRMLGVALFLLVYVPLAGAAAPVARAAVMLAFGLAAGTRIGGERRADPLSLMAAAFVLECVMRPQAATQLGVQLSYLATCGLLFTPRSPGRRARDLRPAGWVRAAWRRLARLVRRALSASAAANLATLPLVAATFGEVAPIGLLLTPLAVPLLAALLASLVLGAIAPDLAPAWAAELPARGLLSLLELADRMPATPVALPPRPFWLVALACWGGLACWWRGRGGRLPLVAAGLTLLPWSPRAAGLEVFLLDVGHGTAVVARGPGLGALVLDAGSRDRPGVVSEALAPLLARWDVPRPWVILSHDHRDHSAGLDWLVERRPPMVFAGALPARLDERIPHDVRRIDPRLGGVRLQPYPDLSIDLLRGSLEPGNEGSRTVVLRAPEGVLVLPGDAEGPGMASQLLQGLPEGPVDVLLLPHHGSDTPLLADLLARLAPERIWVSSGGPPALAAELDRRGLDWRRTGPRGPEGACFLHLLPCPAPRP